MKKGKRVFLLIGFGLSVALIFSGCFMQPTPLQDGGRIAININGGTLAKAITPSIGLTCESYHVTIQDATPTTIVDETITATSKTYEGFIAGDYTITVIGLNDDTTPVALGEGSDTVTAVVGSTVPANITIAEYLTPNGGADVTMDWTAFPGMIASPIIDSGLTPAGGSEVDISVDWTTDTDTANWTDADLAVGWYGLRAAVYDSGAGSPSCGFVTALRIMSAQTSTGVVYLEPNALTGGILVDIDLDLYDPITLTTDVPEGDLEIFSSTTPFDITVGGADAFAWFRQGIADGVGSTYTIDPADFIPGNTYRLDALGWTADCRHMGHLAWQIDYLEYDPMVLKGSFTNGTMGFDYDVTLFEIQSGGALGSQAAQVIVTVSDVTTTFELTAPEAGEYRLRVFERPNNIGSPCEYWENLPDSDKNIADAIVVPLAAADEFHFGDIDYVFGD